MAGPDSRAFIWDATAPCTAAPLGMLFDTVLGLTSSVLTGGPYQRTAYLKINYRNIVPIEKELQFDAGVDRVDGRKIFVSGRLADGDTLLTEADALFVRLKPGQP